MPRPNKQRHVGSESSLAERIAFERELRGMSYEGLASRMGLAGCAINASAIYKIEKGKPAPRRITVDELVAFSRVFEVPVDDLLVPAIVVKEKRLREGLDEFSDHFLQLQHTMKVYDRSVTELLALADDLGYRLELPAQAAVDVRVYIPCIVDIKKAEAD